MWGLSYIPAVPILRILTYFTSRLGTRELVADAVFLVCLVFILLFPNIGNRFFRFFEKAGTDYAKQKGKTVFSLVMLAIFARLLLLFYLPIPVPAIHDEFAHLLAADTFAHGRLANPTHPLWVFFDTIHVNQIPTYMSKYPPGQGAVLAVGELLGNPWIGVLLSVAGMTAAIVWMLQGWLPSRWALLGGVLVVARIGISSYWINSYWGGAVPAIGGALVVGALARIRRTPKMNDALILAAGAFILANSRPLEGFILCAVVLAILIAWLCGPKSPSLRITFPRLVLPFCGAMIVCFAFIAYYNWRLTGNALLLPETLNARTYSLVPDFIWQRPAAPIRYSNPQFEIFYNDWARSFWEKSSVEGVGGAVKHAGMIALKSAYFFLWPEFCIPLLALPWIFRDRSVPVLIFLVAFSFLGSFFVIWFLPHYAGAVTAPIICLEVQMIRHLRQWKLRGRLLGRGLSRAIVLAAIVLAPFHWRSGTIQPETGALPPIAYRAKFATALEVIPGDHLVLVQYGPASASGEWVYNSANIDHAKVVWARVIPGMPLQPLLKYFKGHQVWLAEPDASPPRITPYGAASGN